MAALFFIIMMIIANMNPISSQFQCDCVDNCCCSHIPANGEYYLTTFCDQETACGKSCGDCKWWYSTSAVRWKCGTHLQCCSAYNQTNCATMEVVDSGPACWVEEDANMNIIDATPLACEQFFGSSSCGYSDKRKIICKVVSDDVPLGPGPRLYDIN